MQAPVPPAAVSATPLAARPLVTAADVRAAGRGGTLELPADAIVTPLAADVARELGVALRAGDATATRFSIAIGADHGGFRLKESLRAALESQGHRVRDLGTHGDAACDYPDFAIAVAREVASGACAFGIVVDGAGIGSAMAANRVPGALAASCPDVDAARNAREHNHANVLTLGARRLDEAAAMKIVRTFLSTPVGEARHAKRVAKILALDRHVGRGPR